MGENEKNVFEAARDEAIAAIEDPALSPQARAAAALRADFDIHPAKAGQAAEIVREYQAKATAALKCCDYGNLSQVIERFFRAMRYSGLSQAPVERPQKEIWAPTMISLGWSAWDIDHVFAYYLKPGEEISAVTWEGVTIGDRTVTRRAMRLGAKPRNTVVGDEAWVRGFGPLRRMVRREDARWFLRPSRLNGAFRAIGARWGRESRHGGVVGQQGRKKWLVAAVARFSA